MEFPGLGAHCSDPACNKLDFLPMKCDACHTVFCSEHFQYMAHNCPSAYQKNVQVPECPLCGAPVPGKRGEPPDVAVGAHIDRDCQADPAKDRRKKVFSNRCSHKGCRGKEMVPLVCSDCCLNFCFRHRHAADHACEGKLAAKRRQAAEAALSRMKNTGSETPAAAPEVRPQSAFAEIQGNMTEDEALARALSLSMQPDAAQPDLQAQDTNLARAILNRQRVGGEQGGRCSLS